jgi:hypothetical protein
MTFGLLNSLSSSSTIFGPNIVRRTFFSKTSSRFSSLFVSINFSLTYSWSFRSLTLPDVPGQMTADVFAGHRSTYSRFGFFGVTRAPKYTNSLTTLKFLSLKATVCPASSYSSRINYVFCLLFVDFQPYFCCFFLQC